MGYGWKEQEPRSPHLLGKSPAKAKVALNWVQVPMSLLSLATPVQQQTGPKHLLRAQPWGPQCQLLTTQVSSRMRAGESCLGSAGFGESEAHCQKRRENRGEIQTMWAKTWNFPYFLDEEAGLAQRKG